VVCFFFILNWFLAGSRVFQNGVAVVVTSRCALEFESNAMLLKFAGDLKLRPKFTQPYCDAFRRSLCDVKHVWCFRFLSCAWNRTANHFHCLRKNCGFAFTSTGQMVSHKRKHDRQDLMGSSADAIAMSKSVVLGQCHCVLERRGLLLLLLTSAVACCCCSLTGTVPQTSSVQQDAGP